VTIQSPAPASKFIDPGVLHEKIGWLLCVGVPVCAAIFSYLYLCNFEEDRLDKFLLLVAGIVCLSVLSGFCVWLRGAFLFRKARRLFETQEVLNQDCTFKE
jgi:hypothetical protein